MAKEQLDSDSQDAQRASVPATEAMLKMYTNPLRRRMIKLFTKHVFLRATDIARELEVPVNKVSYHLRALADVGLLEEAPEKARDKRDRVWTGRPQSISLGGPDNPIPDEALASAALQAIAEDHYDLVRRMLAWSPAYIAGETDELHAEFSQSTIRLTEAEFREMVKRISEIGTEFEEAHKRNHPDPDDPEARTWQIDIVAVDDTV